MELEIQIHSGSKTSAHKFELSRPVSAEPGRTEAESWRAKNQPLEWRESPNPLDERHARQGNPQPLGQIGAKPGDLHDAAQPAKAGRRRPEFEKLLHFSSDGEKLIADGEEISPGVYSILIDGRSYEAHVSRRPGDAGVDSSPYAVTVGLRHYLVEIRNPRRWRREGTGVPTDGPQEIVAPMPGRIVKVLVSENQEVVRDQGLMVIEAMKMQNEVRAPRAGRVERVYVQEDTGVEAGIRLLRLV